MVVYFEEEYWNCENKVDLELMCYVNEFGGGVGFVVGN